MNSPIRSVLLLTTCAISACSNQPPPEAGPPESVLPTQTERPSETRIETDHVKLPDAVSFADVLRTGPVATHNGGPLDVVVYDIGKLELTTGKVVASDGFIWGHAFQLDLPIGSHPVLIAVARYDSGDERIALARVNVTTHPVVRWIMGLTEGVDPASIKPGEVACYGVDSGMGMFAEAAALRAIGMEIYPSDSGTSPLLEQMESVYRDTRSWARVRTGVGSAVFFSSGGGDGCYTSYFGYDDQGKLAALMTDFGLLDWEARGQR